MMERIASNYPGLVFSARWFNALSENAKERMPWEVQSLKGGVWRFYYRAESLQEANKMAIGLRNAKGKAPHKHAIRVLHGETFEKGIELPAIKEKHEEKKEKSNADKK